MKLMVQNTPRNGFSLILRGALVIIECCRMWLRLNFSNHPFLQIKKRKGKFQIADIFFDLQTRGPTSFRFLRGVWVQTLQEKKNQPKQQPAHFADVHSPRGDE